MNNKLPQNLTVRYSKKDRCLSANTRHPRRGNADLAFILDMLNSKTYYDNKLLEELEARGYDITTLKFSIDKKD